MQESEKTERLDKLMSSQDLSIGCMQDSLNKSFTRSQSTTLHPSYKTVKPRKTILSFEHRKKDYSAILSKIVVA